MESLVKFKQFVDEIKQSQSRNFKLAVLARYKENDFIKKYLYFIYNPYITTGISDKKLLCNLGKFIDTVPVFSLLDLLDYVKENNTGTHHDIFIVRYYLSQVKSELGQEYSALLEDILCKNVKLGIDALSINKVIENFIPTFNVQLAEKYFENPDYLDGKSFTITEKIDGGRIIALKLNNEVSFYTRAGQLYEGLVDLEKEMLESLPDDVCLDGEITLIDTEGMESKEAYKKTMKIVRKKGLKHGVKMLVFDCMTAHEFIDQECNLTYQERRFDLENMISSDLTYFKILPSLYSGTETSNILSILREQVAKGHEGIMLNINDSKYKFGRTKDLLKCKLMQDIDLEVVGLEEGTGANKGKLGALVCSYKNNLVNVGSGFTKSARERIWENKEDYVGRVCTVQYFEETFNDKGLPSLRFPVFVDFRDDKNADF